MKVWVFPYFFCEEKIAPSSDFLTILWGIPRNIVILSFRYWVEEHAIWVSASDGVHLTRILLD